LRKLIGRIFKRYTSPLQRIAQEHQIYEIETIQAYPVAPWEERIKVIVERDHQKARELAQNTEYSDAIVIATCS
jgi:hypothetical protein